MFTDNLSDYIKFCLKFYRMLSDHIYLKYFAVGDA